MAHISTKHFHWLKLPRQFFAEISELPNQHIPLKRIFQDSCDEGFTLVSKDTGVGLDFYLDKEVKSEGDIVAWHFLPAQKNGPVNKVIILND